MHSIDQGFLQQKIAINSAHTDNNHLRLLLTQMPPRKRIARLKIQSTGESEPYSVHGPQGQANFDDGLADRKAQNALEENR